MSMYSCLGAMGAYGPGWFSTLLLLGGAVLATWWLTKRAHERRGADIT